MHKQMCQNMFTLHVVVVVVARLARLMPCFWRCVYEKRQAGPIAQILITRAEIPARWSACFLV